MTKQVNDRALSHAMDTDDLKEAARLFEWALSLDRKGLSIAADALRDEGRKTVEGFLARSKWQNAV